MAETAVATSTTSADCVGLSSGSAVMHRSMEVDATVTCMSFGERHEGTILWKKGKNVDEIKKSRQTETESATKALGVFDRRGNHLLRNSKGQASGQPAKQAQAFQSITPHTMDGL